MRYLPNCIDIATLFIGLYINTNLLKNFMNKDINLYSLRGINGCNYIMPYVLAGIYKLMLFMKLVIYGDASFYCASNNSRGRYASRISALGLYLKHLSQYSELYSKDYHFSPLLDLFFDQYRTHPIQNCLSLDEFDSSDVEIFNDFITTIRMRAVELKLKKKVADWESKSKKNQKRLMALDKTLFKQNEQLMVIRLDLDYHKAEFSPAEIEEILKRNAELKERDLAGYWAGDDFSEKRVMEGRIALEEVQIDRKHFFANMKGKPSLFKHLVGYVWRIKFTRENGYNWYVVLFFDGSNVQEHECLAQEIGEYWREVITKGRGYFKKYNHDKLNYTNDWALGTIDYRDRSKRKKLIAAMQSFCKTDEMVQVVPYHGCHLFGSGFTHRNLKSGGCDGQPRARGAPQLQNHVSGS